MPINDKVTSKHIRKAEIYIAQNKFLSVNYEDVRRGLMESFQMTESYEDIGLSRLVSSGRSNC